MARGKITHPCIALTSHGSGLAEPNTSFAWLLQTSVQDFPSLAPAVSSLLSTCRRAPAPHRTIYPTHLQARSIWAAPWCSCLYYTLVLGVYTLGCCLACPDSEDRPPSTEERANAKFQLQSLHGAPRTGPRETQ